MPLVPDPKNCDVSVKRAIQGISKKLGYTGHVTHATLTLNHTGIGDQLTLSKVCTTADGLNVLRVTGLQTDDTALTGTLRGAYIDVSNGSTVATGTIRAMELKARTEAPGDTGNNVAVLEGLSISADSKDHSVTTMRAAEFIIDGKTGGTITEAVGLRIANNLQANKATNSYGLQIYRDSFDYTYDISLSLGGHITGDSYINQDLRTTASSTFTGLTLSGLTQGSVVFAGASGVLSQDNSNLFWNNTINRLGIGINSGFFPAAGITVSGEMDLIHTSNEADDHAFEIDVDAAGYGDVKAIDIDYITGDISTGEDEAVILINIDEIEATGGDVFGLEILATEGATESTTKIYGMKTGVLIGPIHQDSGTFENPTIATNDTPSTNVPYMIDGLIGNVTPIFSSVPNDDDYILIGDIAVFEEIEFILTTGSSGAGIKPKFEYSRAGSNLFTEFFPVDGTNGFRNTGVVAWDAGDLTNHGLNTDTTPDTYCIKITRQRTNLTTTPILGFAKVAATTEYIWDKDGDVNFRNLTVTQVLLGADPTNVDHSVTKSYADALVAGAFWDDVDVGTIANVDLSNGLEAGDTIDDYTLVEGDRVLVKEQTDQTENGLYVVLASGAASRAADADTAAEIEGKKCIPLNGTVTQHHLYFCITGDITLGVTDIKFAEVTMVAAHNTLTGIQGGTTNQYYHLTSAEHVELNAWLDDVVLSDGGAMNISGALTATNYTAANLLTACATNAGALDFSAASKTLTVENNAVVSQDYSSDASPTFAGLNLGTGELTCGSINRATGTLTLEINGTAEISITTTTVTLGGNLIIPNSGTIGSVGDTDVMTIDASGNTTFSVFPITPSAAPDANYEVANKKYVDDTAGGAVAFGRPIILTPQCGMAPAASFATLDTIAGGSTPAEAVSVLDFDPDASEYMDFKFALPSGYADGGLDITIYFSMTSDHDEGTPHKVRWEVGFARIDDDGIAISGDHAYDYNGVSAIVPSVISEISVDHILFSDGADMDSLAASEMAILRIYRNHDHADDNATGDAELQMITIKEN